MTWTRRWSSCGKRGWRRLTRRLAGRPARALWRRTCTRVSGRHRTSLPTRRPAVTRSTARPRAGSKLGVMVEVNCETDFVAKQSDFQARSPTAPTRPPAGRETLPLCLLMPTVCTLLLPAGAGEGHCDAGCRLPNGTPPPPLCRTPRALLCPLDEHPSRHSATRLRSSTPPPSPRSGSRKRRRCVPRDRQSRPLDSAAPCAYIHVRIRSPRSHPCVLMRSIPTAD